MAAASSASLWFCIPSCAFPRSWPGAQRISIPATPRSPRTARRFAWTEVAARTSLKSCARINQALLTSIGSLADHVADPAGCVTNCSVSSNPSPSGCLSKAASSRFCSPTCFTFSRRRERKSSSSFPNFRIPIPWCGCPSPACATGQTRFPAFPARGTLLAPDHSFLFTVDWDSFFTLFYGSRSFVARVAAGLNLEGFFATPNTEHAWYNYSFGCATVTLSPEHWQTA